MKKILLTALIACSVFAVNFSTQAAENEAINTRKAGGFDRSRPNNFTATMKKIGRYALLYIPNRLVDATDIFTIDLSLGGGFFAEMQATRYCQFGGSYGESWFLSKGYARQYGVGHKNTTKRLGFLCMEEEVTYVDETTGTVKEYVIDFPQLAIADRDLDAFKDNDVDFWKIGGRLGLIVGAGVGIHPIEIADFLTGFFWLDIMEDDFK
jgi:hypothetical protein